MNAADIDPEWVKLRAEILRRDGHAFRPHAIRHAIEIKSLTTNQWCLLTLPSGLYDFATEIDRDQIYNSLRALQ